MKKCVASVLLIIAVISTNGQVADRPKIEPSRTPNFEIAKNYEIMSVQDILDIGMHPLSEKIAPPSDQFDGAINGMGLISTSLLLDLKELRRYLKNGEITAIWSVSQDMPQSSAVLVLQMIATQNPSAQKIADRLKAKYGTDGKGRTIAGWFSGDLHVLYDPIGSVVGYVSKHEEVLSFDKGRLLGRTFTPNYGGSMEFYSEILGNGLTKRYADGAWYNRAYDLACLAQWFEAHYHPSMDSIGGMLWLLTTDAEGESHLKDLTPNKAATARHREVGEQAAKLLERLPRLSFGFLITEDRRLYSGRFIEASYSKEGGWKLTELLTPRL